MSKRRSVLVLFAHPALRKTRVNRRLVREAAETEGVTLHDVYDTRAMTESQIEGHAADDRQLLEALRCDRLDEEIAAELVRMNEDLARLLRAPEGN